MPWNAHKQGVSRGEELLATLHPLFTTLHLGTRLRGIRRNANPPKQRGEERWRVVKSRWRVPEYSSPLRMPINTGDSGLLVKSEEYLAGSLYENKIKEVSITVPVKQPTSDKCASRLFAVCQLAVYILPVGYFRFLHQSSQVLASIIVSTCIYHRKYLHQSS